MKPEQLHRAVLTATAFGDKVRYRELRGRFGPYDARGEFEHLEGAAAVCLAYRLGETRQRRRRTDLAEPAQPAAPARAAGPAGADRAAEAAGAATAAGRTDSADTADATGGTSATGAAGTSADHTGTADTSGTAGTAERSDRAELGRFMAELRAAGPEHWPEHGPPSNFLEVEGVIRALRGERHLMAEIGGDRMRSVFRFLVRYLTATVPEIHEDFDTVIDQAREYIMRGLMG
ncbi:hypothetical protein [Glycomyces arizonensis]|uniref:hypothetical protein n=1 Tax=Glycomyces arizonensis TaxID=256035 RepID=UPI00041D6787|nr:hypothetical protein [Glycomyces arizonensis]